jgi:hypothetical protein
MTPCPPVSLSVDTPDPISAQFKDKAATLKFFLFFPMDRRMIL